MSEVKFVDVSATALRALAESMGPLDAVQVIVSERLAEQFRSDQLRGSSPYVTRGSSPYVKRVVRG